MFHKRKLHKFSDFQWIEGLNFKLGDYPAKVLLDAPSAPDYELNF